MKIVTTEKNFENDIYDVMHMYFPESQLGQDDGVVLNHEQILEEDKVINQLELSFENKSINKRYENSYFPFKSALEEKKILKRFLKLAIYKMLSEQFNQNMPWGSLTGIRPTRLAHSLIEDGVDPDFIKETLMNNFLVSEQKASLIEKIIHNQKCIIRNENLIDLYINVPVCPTRCSYCTFISSELKYVEKLIPKYVETLIKEIRFAKQIISDKALVVRTVYMGGGTPTVLTSEQLDEILSEINYPISEFTVECGRPDTITEDKLKVLKNHGVTRICINPQTFCKKTLKIIGRSHEPEDVISAYKLAMKYGFDTNMDLIAGLPGEKFPTFKKNIETVLEISPENITVHTLSLKNGAKIEKDSITPEESIVKMVDYAYQRLTEDGYKPYYMYRQKNQLEGLENVGYCRDGKVCLFNVDTMEECCSVIACGANAISKRIFLYENRIERQANVKGIEEYIARIEEMLERKSKLFV